MDSKKSKPAKPRKRRKGSSVGRQLAVNEMLFKVSWTEATLSSSSTGTLSNSTSPSIVGASEYSVISGLFTQVRIVRATLVFTSKQQTDGTISQGRIMIGTNMNMNYTVFTLPTNYAAVQNTTKKATVASYLVRPYRYVFPVPPNLEFADIKADAPSPVTPWAGTPGVVQLYGDGFTASTAYFQIDWEDVVYHLRGRF